MAKKKTASKSSGKSAPSASAEEPSFEDAMEELESIVQRMEQGGGSLESALEDYGVAIGLMKICHKKLEHAERKIELLTGVDADGNPVTEDFRDTDDSLDEKRRSRSSRRNAADNPDNQSTDDGSSLF